MSFSLTNPGPSGDQDRMHAYLDLTNVTDAASAGRFIMRWRRALEDMLASDELARAAAELEKAADAADAAAEERDTYFDWIEDFANQLRPIAQSLDVLDEVTTDPAEVGHILAHDLRRIIESADKITSDNA